MLLTAGLGLLVGIPLGFALHRSGFCMHSATRDFLQRVPSSSLLAYLLALGIQLLLVNALAEEQIFTVPIPPFTWLAAIVGGLLFGMGMVWAKG